MIFSENSATTCPACSLLCDDVTLNDARCQKSQVFFSQPLHASPQIKGKNVSLEAAIAHILNGFKMAKNLHIGGLGTDVEGFRAAYQFAQKTNASLSHMHGKVAQRNYQVLQSTGWQTTTLTEVKNRADVVVCIGGDIVAHHPRFFERIIWTEHAMFTAPNQRKVIYIGKANLPEKNATHIECADADLPNVLSALNALLLEKPLIATEVSGVNISQLRSLAETLKTAKYAVLAWAVKDLNFAHAELTITQITHIINTLNQTTRAAGLPLGSADGETSVQYAHTWLNGRVLNGFEMANSQTDVLVWIDSFNSGLQPPKINGQTFVLGNPNLQFPSEQFPSEQLKAPPDVFIPIATPGLDSTGTMFRVDGTVSLPLQKTRESDLPTLAEILSYILTDFLATSA
jgi:formylmethanofuran dehydrogenase subunit B